MKRLAGASPDAFFARFREDREEYNKVFLLFFYLFSVASASTVGRTAADALFLSAFDASALSKMYLPQSAALILTGLVFQRYGQRLRIDRLVVGLIPAIAALALASRLGVGAGMAWVVPTIYVAYDVFNFLMIVCFWQFATCVLDQRKVKRTIGLVGSGGIVGGIVSGFGLKLVVPLVGTANLIYFYAGLQGLALAAALALLRSSGDPAETFASAGKSAQGAGGKAKARRAAQAEGLFASVPHLKYVAVMSAALILVLTFVDYQFKVILKSELQNDALAGFMGSFYGFAGLLALVLQMFVAGKVLTRFGVMTAILVFPAVLLVGSVGLLAAPVLAMAVALKGSDKVVGDTIHSSVQQLIMFPVPPKWRNRAKSFLDGIVRNGAKGLAAISLLALSPILSPQELGYIVIGLLVVCIGAAMKVKGAYLKTLVSTLQTDQVKIEDAELNVMDPASLRLLTDALRSADKQQALYAFRVLRGIDGFDLSPYLPALLRHPAREVVVEALAYAERRPFAGFEAQLIEKFDDADARVASRAIAALSAYADEAHLERISACLDGEDLERKCGAIAGLVKHYGIEGMFRAVGALKQLLESADEEERAAAAALFGSIGIRQFYKPLRQLLRDPALEVRRSALQSASVLQAPELIDDIVPLLRSGGTRKDAIEALAAYDEKESIPRLAPWFERAAPPLHLPKVFERLASPAAFETLLDVYEASGFEMRGGVLEALNRMRRRVEPDARQASRIEAYLLGETRLYRELSERFAGLSAVPRYEEAAEVGEQLRAATVQRIFQWLALLYDGATIRAVYANWREGDARQQANAMEVVDQLAHGEVRAELARLMGEGSRPADRSAAAEADGTERLEWLERQPDEWLREVVRYAARPEESEARRELMERIRLLRGYELFRKLTSRELADVAHKLTERRAARGEPIFPRGAADNALYLVRSGRVGFYRDGVKVGERQAGESFGQSGLLTRRLRSADTLAEEACVFWRLDSEDFFEVMFDRSSIAIEMMRLLSRRLRAVLSQQRATPGGSPEKAAAAIAAGSEAAAASLLAGGERPDSLLRRVLILQKIDLFSHLSESDLIQLAQLVDETEYEAGETICALGDYGEALYGIIEGSVRIHREGKTLAVLGEGDYFGEMAIIDSGPRSADCTATAPTVVLELHREQVFSLCFRNMDVLRSMMQVMGDRLKGMAG